MTTDSKFISKFVYLKFDLLIHDHSQFLFILRQCFCMGSSVISFYFHFSVFKIQYETNAKDFPTVGGIYLKLFTFVILKINFHQETLDKIRKW